ncbi:MAG: hydantoinase/oxoprolinase family protein [Thermodesulfobacteriota bacterium]
MEREVTVIGSDAGGTMTDMFVIDKVGDFAVGKAATTPHNESIGFWGSLADAFEDWNLDWNKISKETLDKVLAIVYSGTAMLNTLITRTGKVTGIICTKGFEDTLIHERGCGIHAGYSYQDKVHKQAHHHNEPFVPKKLIRGVTERTSIFGEIPIPLYESEVRKAGAELLDKGVEAIVIWFLCSYLNPSNEKRAAEIVREVMKEKNKEVPLYLSGELAPIAREVSRLNAVILQAYGAEPGREHLLEIERKLYENNYKNPLQIVLADGGIANITYPALYKACFSGPIGGLLGGKYVSQVMDMPNLVCSDMGGTSFDVGLIMGGETILLREVELGRTVLNIPTMVMDSIGAGCGMYVTIDPESKRVEIGPGSAGSDPGPVCYDMGNYTPTVMDCVVILGLLNPDYYLGGKLKLKKDLALKAVKEKCSDVLGVDPYDFSEGVLTLINDRMNRHINTVLSVRGYSPADYYLIGYGGAGPLFLGGYAGDMPFKGVFTVPWAAAFSAFGCTVVDYVHRYQKSTLVQIPPGADEQTKMFMGSIINSGWQELEEKAIREMKEEGFKEEQVTFSQIAYVRYFGQMEDLEVKSPVKRIESAQDMDKLINAFEEMYSRVYVHGARHPEAGYQVLELGLICSSPKPKPELRKFKLEDKKPSLDAYKGEREVYVSGKWEKAALYEMDRLLPGNEVKGLAIIEAPATTLPVPEGKKVVIDEYRRYWLRKA